jgi:radial spoke head protein 9
VERNEAFRGLKGDCTFGLEHYSHFRNVQAAEKKENLEREDTIFQSNFLDDLITDKPNGAWSIQKDASGTVALLRTSLWPGFYAFHK